MFISSPDHVEWLEWSGLPLELNKVRAGGWTVFLKIAELDCRRNRLPDTVEVTLQELGERTGYDPETIAKIIEALRKKHYLRCYLPETPDEAALLEIRLPLKTPRTPEEIARLVEEPRLRDITRYRYAAAPPAAPDADLSKVQEVVDLYFNHVSQKMNSFVLEQLEIVARRFPLDAIRQTMERAARHNMRTIGWVLKELIRAQAKEQIQNRH